MKKFRKFLLGTFACASILSLVCAFGSCGGSKDGNLSSSTPTDSSTPSAPVDPDALTGFDVPETAFASYGFAVEIQPPIVIDGYGNVLGVSYTVKNSAGETVKDFNRGFFATDKNGYTVTYSVTVPSGETKTATTKYTVLSFAEDSEIALLDVKDGDVDFTKLVGDETTKTLLATYATHAAWTLKPTYYNAANVTYGFNGNTVDLSKVPHGVYTLSATVGGTEVYRTGLDVYDSTAPFEYTDIAGQNLTVSDHRTGNGLISSTQWNQTTYFGATAEEKTTVGATGDYYKLIVDGDFWKWSHSVKFLPQTHTKAYYEQFADKTIAFDWWFDMDGADSYEFTVYGASAATSYTKNTPRMVTIPMQDLLDDWDNFMDEAKNSKDNFKGAAWIKTGGGSNGTNFKLFIGNVRVLNYEDKTTLLNVANGNVDLSELITDSALKQVFKANAETNVWKLTKNGVTTTFTGNTQSLTALSHGIYEVTAETTGVAYGTKVDLYDGKVFELFDVTTLANGLSIDLTDKYTSATTLNGVCFWMNGDNIRNTAASISLSSVTSVGGGETGITEKSGSFVKVDFTTKEGVTASPYRLGFALMHTKEYYELFADKSFSVEFVCDTSFNGNAGKGVVVTQNYTAKSWKSGTATVQSLLDDWDNASIGKFALIDTHWSGMPNATYYIGNVQLVEAE